VIETTFIRVGPCLFNSLHPVLSGQWGLSF